MDNKILVTGGSGFIGSNFIHYLINNTDYQRIINLDKLTYAGNNENLINIQQNIRYKFIKGNICDRQCIKKIFQDYSPNKIVHFAAESHVDRSIDGPKDFINTNIVGTSILLEESLSYYNKLKKLSKSSFKFHHISTDEVFGSLGEKGFFVEDSPYDPSSPYSASKASSDHLVRAWHRTFGLPVTISNCSNNYGPYQFPEKLIPKMILNIFNNKELPVYAKGNNSREWLNVLDHCEALFMLYLKGKSGESYNIGSGINLKNIVLVKKLLKLCKLKKNQIGKKSKIIFVEDRPGHDFRYALNSKKIYNRLKWKAKIKIDNGLIETINWYFNNKNFFKNKSKLIYEKRLGLKND